MAARGRKKRTRGRRRRRDDSWYVVMAGTDPIGEPFRERSIARADASWREHVISYLYEESRSVGWARPITVHKIQPHELRRYREWVNPQALKSPR